jgi:ubiquinone biosynthesis protein COQ4
LTHHALHFIVKPAMNPAKKLLFRFKTVYAAWRLSSNPEATENILSIGFHQDSLAQDSIESGKIRDPFTDYVELEEQWNENYVPEKIDLQKLIIYPSDTLGYHYAKHILEKKINPNSTDSIQPKNKYHWLRLRIQKTHDVWHVLSGFDTDQAGEVGSQGIYFAQYVNGQSALVLGGGIMKTIMKENYDITEKMIDAFIKGYILGKKAKPLLPVKWENHWKDKLEDLRSTLDINIVRYEKVSSLTKMK